MASAEAAAPCTEHYPEFSCRGELLGTLSNMLRAMHVGKKRDQQLTNVHIQSEGMTFISSKAKSMISRCNLRKDYFPTFNLLENVDFCIDLSTFIQVLTIFGTNCECHLEYKKTNNFLRVFLSNFEQQSITECELYTFAQNEDIPDLRWNEHRIINRLSGEAPFFRDIFSEIDALAKNEAIVWFYIKKGNEMEIDEINIDKEDEEKKIMDGNDGNDDKNKNKKEEIESSITMGVTSDTLQFQGTIPMTYDVCKSFEFNKTAKYQYRLSLLRPALRAIAKSDLIRINFNQQNAIQIQHVFHGTESQNFGWVEFVILPQDTHFIDNDDDDNDNED